MGTVFRELLDLDKNNFNVVLVGRQSYITIGRLKHDLICNLGDSKIDFKFVEDTNLEIPIIQIQYSHGYSSKPGNKYLKFPKELAKNIVSISREVGFDIEDCFFRIFNPGRMSSILEKGTDRDSGSWLAYPSTVDNAAERIIYASTYHKGPCYKVFGELINDILVTIPQDENSNKYGYFGVAVYPRDSLTPTINETMGEYFLEDGKKPLVIIECFYSLTQEQISELEQEKLKKQKEIALKEEQQRKILPSEIYKNAKIEEEQGNFEEAMKLYEEATYFHLAAKIAEKLGYLQKAKLLYIRAGDTWNADKIII